MCERCDKRDTIVHNKLQEALQEIYGDNDVVNNFVVVGSCMDKNGEQYVFLSRAPGQMDWQSHGLLDWAWSSFKALMVQGSDGHSEG